MDQIRAAYLYGTLEGIKYWFIYWSVTSGLSYSNSILAEEYVGIVSLW